MRIKQLDLIDAEYIAHRLAVETMDSKNEPMPPFHTREPGKLESSLAEPFQTFNGKYLHRTFTERAAVLFYLITKNHCFGNGNKRMAVTLTMSFYFINKRWLDIPPKALYDIACEVAKSDARKRHIHQQALRAMFKKYEVPFPWR